MYPILKQKKESKFRNNINDIRNFQYLDKFVFVWRVQWILILIPQEGKEDKVVWGSIKKTFYRHEERKVYCKLKTRTLSKISR